MSIPERFYRIARGKLGELKDWIDRVDTEYAADPSGRAARELDDAVNNPVSQPPKAVPVTQQSSPMVAPGSINSQPIPDPLGYHYRIFGLQPGADFAAVEESYRKLIARADPSRFPLGSDDAAKAADIRSRIETSYRALRDELDPTARRFDRLEFDFVGPGESTSDGKTAQA